MRKFFAFLITVFLVLGLLFFAIYYFRIKNSPEGATIKVSDFIPFNFNLGRNPTNVVNNLDIQTTVSTTTPAPIESKTLVQMSDLRKISDVPVAGAYILKNKNGEFIRFMERAAGHINEIQTFGTEIKRLTKTTIPKIYEAVWTEGGNSLIARYLDDTEESVTSFYGKIKLASTTAQGADSVGKLEGNFLTSDISNLAVSPSGNKIFYTITDGNSGFGIISNPNGTKPKTILESPLSEWLAFWPNENTIVLATKPKSGVSGFAFTLNSSTGKMSEILEGSGLIVLPSSDLSKILYSESFLGQLLLNIKNLKDDSVKSLGLSTLSTKCVWGNKNKKIIYCAIPKDIPTGNYPDDWYQGLASFNDDIFAINSDTGISQKIADIKKMSGQDIDAIDLVLAPDDDYLIFTNKKDLSLWSLKISTSTAASF